MHVRMTTSSFRYFTLIMGKGLLIYLLDGLLVDVVCHTQLYTEDCDLEFLWNFVALLVDERAFFFSFLRLQIFKS